MAKGMQLLRALSQLSLTSEHSHFAKTTEDGAMRMTNFDRVHYFVRGGFVGHRSCASSKHLSSHLPVDGARFLGGQNGVAFAGARCTCGCRVHKEATPSSMLMFEKRRYTGLGFSRHFWPHVKQLLSIALFVNVFICSAGS
ncbi:hypothetical protein TNCV_729011 [Trichonephila clavipes]|nr:hypothetical protein TNCV_729011 [Trichonephila clavipes]